jgi:hypothetical protein
MEAKTIYFEYEGEINTDAALAAANHRAKELGLKTVLVASTRGNTAIKAVDVFKGMKVVIVTHVYGGMEPNTQEFLDENRQIVENKGGKILTTTHGFGGINGAFRSEMPRPPAGGPGKPIPAGGPPQGAGGPPPGPRPAPSPVPGDIISQTLSVLCRGMKVAAEITIMAADSGLVRTDEEVLAIAGSGRGADTAVVVQPANSQRFFDLKIKEIICKPRT